MIKPLKPRFQPILPLAYDDSISYMEFLGKVTKTINALIENINDNLTEYIETNIDELFFNASYDKATETLTLEFEKKNPVIPVLDYYTKEEVDALLRGKANVDNVYTISETDSLLSTKASVVALDTKADRNNVYTKNESNSLLNEKADSDMVYNKTETNTLLNGKADSNNVYTKTQTDTLLNSKANADTVYTKAQTDNMLDEKADSDSVYSKTETDSLLSTKANSNNVYTKGETDTLLLSKANSNTVYTKTETNTLLSAKANTADVYDKNDTDTLLLAKAPINSPALTGTPTTPSQSVHDSSTKIANTEFVVAETESLITGTPEYASGWSTGLTPSLARNGVVAIFTFGVQGGNAVVGWNTIATLPVDFRPKYIFNTAVINNKTDEMLSCRISGDGNVQVYYSTADSSAQVRGTIVYFINK